MKFKGKEAVAIGCGMIARGEVALAVYSTASWLIYFENGKLVGIDPLFATIMLIITTSILCPILIKVFLKTSDTNKDDENHNQVNAEDYVSVKAAMEAQNT